MTTWPAVLGDVIGDLLPAALAVALSPIPIIAVVVVLGSPHARTAGPALALGWVCGLAAVSLLVAVVLSGSVDSDSDDLGLAWLQLAVGSLFFVLAAKQWQKRPREGEPPKIPSWMATVDTAAAPRAAALGLALSGANPKNLALTLATSASIAEAGSTRPTRRSRSRRSWSLDRPRSQVRYSPTFFSAPAPSAPLPR